MGNILAITLSYRFFKTNIKRMYFEIINNVRKIPFEMPFSVSVISRQAFNGDIGMSS